jgi:hypothetical protein
MCVTHSESCVMTWPKIWASHTNIRGLEKRHKVRSCLLYCRVCMCVCVWFVLVHESGFAAAGPEVKHNKGPHNDN